MPYAPLNLETVAWETLIVNGQQYGSGYFTGIPRQRGGMRGHGIGGIISAILRMIPTFLASPVGQQLVNTGQEIATDVVSGEKISTAAKQRGRQAIRNLTGLGRKRQNTSTKAIAISVKPHSAKRSRTTRLYRL